MMQLIFSAVPELPCARSVDSAPGASEPCRRARKRACAALPSHAIGDTLRGQLSCTSAAAFYGTCALLYLYEHECAMAVATYSKLCHAPAGCQSAAPGGPGRRLHPALLTQPGCARGPPARGAPGTPLRLVRCPCAQQGPGPVAAAGTSPAGSACGTGLGVWPTCPPGIGFTGLFSTCSPGRGTPPCRLQRAVSASARFRLVMAAHPDWRLWAQRCWAAAAPVASLLPLHTLH